MWTGHFNEFLKHVNESRNISMGITIPMIFLEMIIYFIDMSMEVRALLIQYRSKHVSMNAGEMTFQ